MMDYKERKTRLNGLLFERIECLVQYLYPQGHRQGHSWRYGSMDINLKTAWWGDFDGSTPSMSTNLIDLWIHVTGSDFKTAIREIIVWLGMPESELPPAYGQRLTNPEPERKLILPPIDRPSQPEIRQISTIRAIPARALELAVRRQHLWAYWDRWDKARAWLLTDSARKSAVARRLDGLPWQAPWAKGAKSKTLKGSWGKWPIGLPEAASYPAVAIMEGAPNFLALLEFAIEAGVSDYVAPIAMAGATMPIPESQLPRLRGKRIRIFIDDDEAGLCAAKRWLVSLNEIADVDAYVCGGFRRIGGGMVKDLNDMLLIDPAENREDAERLLDFVKEET
jgi:hypothetical protein